MVYGLWFMVYGLWFMVYGLWFMVYGLWFMVYGLWFMVYGVWFMVHGLWFMVYAFLTMDDSANATTSRALSADRSPGTRFRKELQQCNFLRVTPPDENLLITGPA